MNRQRFKVTGDAIPNGKQLILNEILLNRSTIPVPEFEFTMNDDDKFYFPSVIVILPMDSRHINTFINVHF